MGCQLSLSFFPLAGCPLSRSLAGWLLAAAAQGHDCSPAQMVNLLSPE